MLKISGLFVYPIKSLGGIAVSSAQVTSRGLKHDRRWMLVDEHNRFLSQREVPQMALLFVEITGNGLLVMHRQQPEEFINIPFLFEANETALCSIWDDTCLAEFVDNGIDKWFTEMLQVKCRLVYMPEAAERPVDQRYARAGDITSFADAFPVLIIGQASLDELNGRLKEAVPMDRFRPNIVFTGSEAFLEDQMQHFSIKNINFFGVKPCARCPVVTIDQEHATKGKEPLKTLSSYRKKNNKVYFGQNLIYEGLGIISVDDEIRIKELRPEKLI